MKSVVPHVRPALTMLAIGLLVAQAHAAGKELCEPARLAGKNIVQPAAESHADEGMMRGPGMGKGMMRRKGMGRGHAPGEGRHRGNPVRHRVIMMGPGLPDEYATLKNPLPATPENIEAGKKLYEEHCASCHGAKGRGDGEAGRELDPKPADIAFIMDKPIATDGFLFWTITEGGEKLNTAMPAFRDVLSEEQRWQIIHFLRTLPQ